MVQSILQMAKCLRRKFLLVVYVHFHFVQHPRMLRLLLYCLWALVVRVMSPRHIMHPSQRHFRSPRLIVALILPQFHDDPGARSECIRFRAAFANPLFG